MQRVFQRADLLWFRCRWRRAMDLSNSWVKETARTWASAS